MHFDSNTDGMTLTTERPVEPKFIVDNLELALAKDLASVPQVRHVLADKADDSLLVWVAIAEPEPAVRRKIYQKELALITGFPEINFDFNLIPTMGRGINEIVTAAHIIFSRPE